MKGTIMIFLQMKSYPLIALIPVPMEGTMVLLLEIAINSHVLIPVPTEGTMAKLYKINNNSTVLFR